MLTKDEIITILKQHKDRLAQEYQVKSIALFGSYARGEATQMSDVDLLVDMPSSFENYFDLKYYLEQLLQTKVDLGKENTLRKFIRNSIEDELIYV